MIQEATAGLYLTSPSGETFTHPFFLLASCIAVKPFTAATEPLASAPRPVELWISPDPTRQYYSPYTYCGNNPISCVDKDGRVGENASLQYMMSTVLGIEPGKFSSGNSGPASENMEVANRRVGTAIDFAGIWFLPARALGLAFTGLEVGGALQSGDHAQAGSMVLEEGIKAKGGQELGGGVKGFLFGEAAKFLFRKFGSEGAGALPDPGQPSIDLRLSAPADASHVKGR